jgi:hypothetical protein
LVLVLDLVSSFGFGYGFGIGFGFEFYFSLLIVNSFSIIGDEKGVPQGCCFCFSCYYWGAWVNDEPSMVLQEFSNQNQSSV